MRRRWVWLFAAVLICCALPARAQQPAARIGFLSVNTPSAMSSRVSAFQAGLRELGYIEGRNISITYKYAAGKLESVNELAAELVRERVAVIVTEGPSSTRAAKAATSTIPIVMGQDPDPVATGFVASLSRPAGNITGLTSLRTDLSAKRVEVLKRAIPSLNLIAVIGAEIPGTQEALRETQLAANTLGTKVQYHDLRAAEDIGRVFRAAREERAGAMIVLANPYTLSRRSEVAALAIKERIPVMYYTTEFVDDGGLMSYGVNVAELFRRSAVYVDKLLKGAKPAELPIEQPTKFDLVINLGAARKIGLAIPQAVTYQADRLIE